MRMWNSNSVTAWLLVSAGLDAAASQPPNGGRAPGWDAGVAVAKRRPPTRSPERASGGSAATPLERTPVERDQPSPIVAGLDVAEVAPDGRLHRVTGFWGDLPEQ